MTVAVERGQKKGSPFEATIAMTYLLVPPALAAAVLGVSISLHPGQPTPPSVLPSLVLVSAPIGEAAVTGLTIAHPVMPPVDPVRSVRVVLASPFPGR